jgi:glutathione S-transferase
MTDLTLFHFPGACSNVCLNALEEAGLDYEIRLVDLSRAEQTGDAYLSIVPLGKVPALQSRDGLVTENAAILTYIDGRAPEGLLFPKADTPIKMARRQAGLSFCSANLHPIVRGLLNPSRITDGDGEGVRAMSKKLAKKSFGYADRHLTENGWWLGEWSLIDVYLNWALSVACKAGYDLSPFPALAALHDRLAERPAFRRVMEINEQAMRDLEARAAA